MNFEVNLENLTQEEQEQFNALVEKANKPKSRAWKPEVWEKYYTVDRGKSYIWKDDIIDRFNYTIGNCFKTQEEAEFALERLKVIAEMKRYIAEHDDVELDWDNPNQLKYYLAFNRRSGAIDYASIISMQAVEASLCTSVGSVLLGMIKEIGQDRIKRYYFGVE
jgi:hypothetical protein